VHDLGWERHPEIYPWALRTRLSLLVRHSARRAVRVITPSHYTAEDVVRLYGIPERKIRVVYGALNTAFAPVHNPDERERVRRRYHLPDEYLLYVGSIEPKKNVHRLIEAFAALRRTYRVPHKLVIAGKSLWLSEPILKLPAELGIEHEVLFTGQVPDEDLAPLYTGATALAFLGMYEGFGYPPFEAMACGTPAIVANRTSLAELTGGAAVQVDPDQQHEVVAGLLRLLTDDALRDDLRQEGLRRLRDFQPAPLARQLIGVYEECLAGVPQPRRVPAPGTAQHREEDMV
jgi:glycosyltransferase involved in cell wall biosynthesis